MYPVISTKNSGKGNRACIDCNTASESGALVRIRHSAAKESLRRLHAAKWTADIRTNLWMIWSEWLWLGLDSDRRGPVMRQGQTGSWPGRDSQDPEDVWENPSFD